MKHIFKPGHIKIYKKTVTDTDVASFHGETIHPVYATFSLARDFEWCSRLFFIEMKEEDEEGVGTLLHIEHLNPARIGDEVIITATIEELKSNELICIIEARSGNRVIAKGKTGQKMLKKEKLKRLFGND
jgi:predicted thioesterase